jgi:hypothetical protein
MDLLAFEEKLITKNYKASPASSAFLFVCLSVRISSQIFTVRHPLSKERANGGRSVVRSGHFGLCSALVMHIRYNNEKSSPELEEFLEWLATRVKVRIFVDSFFFFFFFPFSFVIGRIRDAAPQLQGWNRFRGGLNTRSNLTGTESFYTVFRGFEIMFHISTYIPYTPNDPQQVERKVWRTLLSLVLSHSGFFLLSFLSCTSST